MTTPTAAQADEKARVARIIAAAYMQSRDQDGATRAEIAAQEVLAALRPEGDAVAWPKDPETGLNDMSLPTLLKMTRADVPPPAPAGVKEARDALVGARDAMCRAADILGCLGKGDDAERLRRQADYCRGALSAISAAHAVWHPDDAAVDGFAAAMKAKLAKKRAEGRGGWQDKDDCSNAFLSKLLREHIDKGDPVDVGNLAMMIQQRGERIASLLPPSTEAQAGSPAEALPSQSGVWEWRSRLKGGAWDAWEQGRFGQEIPPFADVQERWTGPAALAKPASEPAGGGVREALEAAYDFLGGVDGASEVRGKLIAALAPSPSAGVKCTYCGDTGTIPDRVDGEITCTECGYATPPAPVQTASVGAVAAFLKERDESLLAGEADDAERTASAQEILRLASLTAPTQGDGR